MMNVLEMEKMSEKNKEIFYFFKQLNIEDVKKLIVIPSGDDFSYYTCFRFSTENGKEFTFIYGRNKKIDFVGIKKEYKNLILDDCEKNKYWMEHIWEQFAEHFNLRVRLLFINENTPWSWDLKYVK
jgi:hypothetical protein